MWRLYLDENLPVSLVPRLWALGFDATCARDRKRLQEGDWDQLRAASLDDRTLVTNDADFLARHRDWMARQEPHCGIIVLNSHEAEPVFQALTAYLSGNAAEDHFSECRVLDVYA